MGRIVDAGTEGDVLIRKNAPSVIWILFERSECTQNLYRFDSKFPCILRHVLSFLRNYELRPYFL